MNAFLTIAVNCWREQLRSKFFSMSLIFGAVIIYISTLLGILSADQEVRVLLDFGLSFIDILVCAGAAFATASGILQEIELKTVTLILTRPVPRPAYLAGRFAGTMIAAAVSTAAMAALHLCLLFFKGWSWEWSYLAALYGIVLKALLTAGVATLLTLISTSMMSALVMTGIFWASGHFLMEIRYLLWYGSGSAHLRAAAYVLPNMALVNFRDRMHLPASVIPAEPLLAGGVYALVYAAAMLALSAVVFRRREF